MIAVTLGMLIGGVGAGGYFVLTHDDPQPPAKAGPGAADTSTPDGLAGAVIARLNTKDLDGIIALTCEQGRSTGRRELTKAIPALDPASPPDVRATRIDFELRDVTAVPQGHRAGIVIRFTEAGAPQSREGSMLIQQDGDHWTLCGMDSPQIGAGRLLGNG